MAKKSKNNYKKSSKKKNETLPVLALILNILILPGLGSIIGGKTKTGVWQIVLFAVGVVLSLILVGIPLIIAAWIWGLITGIQMIQENR